MKFPNAEKGIGKIFIAEILALIGTICVAAAAIFATLAIGTTSGTMLILAGAFAIIMVIVMLISYIINIVGIAQASKDEDGFKTALYLTIFGIISTVVTGILSGVFPDSNFVSGIKDILPDIINLFIMICIVLGIRSMAAQLNDSAMERKGDNIIKVLFSVEVIILVARVIALIIRNNIGATIAVIVLCIAGVLNIVLYVLYLAYLSKAKKMLK